MTERPQTFRELRDAIASDVYRYSGRFTWFTLLKALTWGLGERFTIWMRLAGFFKQKGISYFPLYVVAALFHRRYMIKFGMMIPCSTRIAPGLYIGHFGGIAVSHLAVIGRNCNLSHCVTIGGVFRGPRAGAPVIGDNVYFAPGSKVIGKVVVGNNVAVGANCVVTCDVPDNAVVVGVPGKVISFNGSEGYIQNTGYGLDSRGTAATQPPH